MPGYSLHTFWNFSTHLPSLWAVTRFSRYLHSSCRCILPAGGTTLAVSTVKHMDPAVRCLISSVQKHYICGNFLDQHSLLASSINVSGSSGCDWFTAIVGFPSWSCSTPDVNAIKRLLQCLLDHTDILCPSRLAAIPTPS